MKETLHPPPMPAWPFHGRRITLQAGLMALLLLLPAAGFGLLARKAVPNAPVADTREKGGPAAREYQPRAQVASPSRSLHAILTHPDFIPTHHHPLLGRRAPDFELADAEGKVWNLGELLEGRPAVLIFSYGFHCIGCVRQLFDVNAELPLFREVGARVVAISADPPELTRQWFEEHGPFGFPVLSDPGNKVAHAYHAFRRSRDTKTPDILRHGTFVIDRDRTVGWVNVGDAPFRRNPALLSQLAKMEGRVTFPGGTLP